MSTEPAKPTATPEGGETDELFDYGLLRDYAGFVLRSPRRHPTLAAASFALVAAVAAASSLVLPDVYQVQTSILALRNPAILGGAEWDAPTRAARQTVLRRDNLTRLCDEVDLVDRHIKGRSPAGRFRAWLMAALTRTEPTREEVREALVDTLEARLWVAVSTEGTVTIGVHWPNKQMAYDIVDAAAQNFLEARHASESADLGESISVLEGRAAKLQQTLDARVEELEKRQRQHPRRRRVAASSGIQKDAELARIASALAAKRQALVDLEEFRRRRTEELRSQLFQKETVYADRHPEVLAARQSIAAMSQPSSQIEALRAEARALEREFASRGGRLEATAGGTVRSFVGDPLELRPQESEDVQSEVERGQLRLVFDQYANVLLRLEAARLELDLARAAFKARYSVISPPKLPRGPYKNYALRRMLAGLLGGVALAFFASVGADLRGRRILERWQIERSLGLPVLGEFGR